MIKKLCLVFLDPRGVISRDTDSLVRHMNYSELIRNRLFPDHDIAIEILLITPESSLDIEGTKSQTLEMHFLGKPSRFSVSFIMQTIDVLRGKGFSRTLIIVGDPWESFLHAYIVRIFLGESTLIQTNIHADIFDDKWVNQKFIHMLRSKFSWLSIKRSNSIRVVSSQVAERISQKFPNKSITNAPIATNFNLTPRPIDRKNNKKHIVLGWIGRFDEDRGVQDFVEFVIRLNMINATFEIKMAGRGKLLEQTKKVLNNELGPERISYLGYLQGADLNKVYEDIDILLTFAQSESYGLAIREALRFGKPVWGVESLGLQRLQDLVGEKFVRVLDSNAELNTLESTMDDLASCVIPANVSAKISKIDAENISLLIESWAELLSTNIPKVK